MNIDIPEKCQGCDHLDIYVDEGDNAFDTELRKNTGRKVEVSCLVRKCVKEEEDGLV